MDVKALKLEVLLKKEGRERGVDRVLNVEEEEAANKGDHYASVMTRLKIKVILGSGKVTTRSLLLKKLPSNKANQDMDREFSLFKNEITAYGKVLPGMEALMEEFGDWREPLWCQCVEFTPYDEIILEDLSVRGYRCADRIKRQDFEHALMMLKALGRFHAISYVLNARGDLCKDTFPPYFGSTQSTTMLSIVNGAFKIMIPVIRKNWDQKWIRVASKLEEIAKTLTKDLSDLYNTGGPEFNVLNHGDLWTSNMLFQYDKNSDHPIGFKMIDFQICHYNSYGWDLTYYLYSSVRPEVLKEKKGALLEAYRESLSYFLELYGVGREEAPAVCEMEEELRRLWRFQVLVLACMTPIMIAEREDAFDMEAMLLQSTAGYNSNMFTSERYTKHLEAGLTDLVEKGLL